MLRFSETNHWLRNCGLDKEAMGDGQHQGLLSTSEARSEAATLDKLEQFLLFEIQCKERENAWKYTGSTDLLYLLLSLTGCGGR